MSVNYMMILQYDGTRYNGWQKQGNTKNTIQGRLEEVLSRYFGQQIEVHGSGRTDAGVHAMGQTASFKVDQDLPEGRSGAEMSEGAAGDDHFKLIALKDGLNGFLPEDIRIISLTRAEPRFHARLNAKEKEYRYYISLDQKKDVFARRYMIQLEEPRKLDIQRMEQAAGRLVGEHDFAGFSDNRSNKSTVRSIYDIRFEKEEGLLTVIFRGNGFLYHMVRLIMGTLLEIGLGRAEEPLIRDILETKDRKKVPAMAPAQGLFLYRVSYQDP